MKRRPDLAMGECVVTRDGSVVGTNWLQSARAPSAQTGMLAREEEIHELVTQVGLIG